MISKSFLIPSISNHFSVFILFWNEMLPHNSLYHSSTGKKTKHLKYRYQSYSQSQLECITIIEAITNIVGSGGFTFFFVYEFAFCKSMSIKSESCTFHILISKIFGFNICCKQANRRKIESNICILCLSTKFSYLLSRRLCASSPHSNWT